MRIVRLLAPILVTGCSLFAGETHPEDAAEVTNTDAAKAGDGSAPDSEVEPDEGATPDNDGAPAGKCDLDALRQLSTDLERTETKIAVRKVWPRVQEACGEAISSMAVPVYAPTMVRSLPSPPAPDAAYRSMVALACPEWEKVGGAVQAAPAPTRGLEAFEACNFGRFDVVSADEVAANATAGLISWGLHAWMLDQGLEAEHAKPITRMLLALEAYTVVSPSVPYMVDLPDAEASEAADVADVELSRTFIDVDGEIVAKIEDGRIAEADHAGHLVPKLFDALSKKAAAESASAGESWDAQLVLAVDGTARFDTLVDVLYTAGRAEFTEFAFLVETPESLGPRLLSTGAPKARAPDDPELDDSPFMTVAISSFEISMGQGAGSDLTTTTTSNRAVADFAGALAKSDPRAHRAFISASPETTVNDLLGTAAKIRGRDCRSKDASGCVLSTVHIVSGDAHSIATPLPGDDSTIDESEPGSVGIGLANDREGSEATDGQASKARVRPGTAKVEGSLDERIIRRIVRAHVSEVRACYSKSLAKDPASSGTITIVFEISSSGSVDEATVASSTLKDSQVGKCTGTAVKRWKFPKPRSGSVKVTYPFELTSG